MGTPQPPASPILRFSSPSEASLVTRKGQASANPTRSPTRAAAFRTCRLNAGPMRTSRQGPASARESHSAGASPQSSAWRPSLFQTRTERSGAPLSGPSRTWRTSMPSQRRVRVGPSIVASIRAILGIVRWVRKFPPGSTTRKRRSPTAPRASTSAEATPNPRRDFTGWIKRAARFIPAASGLPRDVPHLDLDAVGVVELLRPLCAQRLELARPGHEALLEGAYRLVEGVDRGGKALGRRPHVV